MADLKLVKELRSQTGCGISDCNKALSENDNNLEKAIDFLRKKGLSSANKKSYRITSEGLIATNIIDNRATIVEINSETDFVSKNEVFQNLVEEITYFANDFENIEDLKNAKYPNKSISVDEEIKTQIAIIGENINLRRFDFISIDKGVISQYIHNKVKNNMGKLGVLVALESDCNTEKLQELGKQIAMHIAATKPESLDIDSMDPEKISREIEILKDQARASGKPENIIDKMIHGRIRKYYEEVVLMEQSFVMNDKIKIKDLIKESEKELGSKITIKDFKLFILGQGIKKKEEDFAEEVNKIINN